MAAPVSLTRTYNGAEHMDAVVTPTEGPKGYTSDEEVVHQIPIDEILSDSVFNCRGELKFADWSELAKAISKVGLLQAITVQPFTSPTDPKIKYRIVMGHCRYAACKSLKWPTIKAIIREFSADDGFLANALENLVRAQLNIKQESKVVKLLKDRGLTQKQIQDKLEKTSQWVQIRLGYNTLPEKIQEDLLVNNYSQKSLLELISIPSEPRRYKYLRTLKEKKEAAENAVDNQYAELMTPFEKQQRARKFRSPAELDAMKNRLYDAFDANLATRALAWAAGIISTAELYDDCEKYSAEYGYDFQRPKDERDKSNRDDV